MPRAEDIAWKFVIRLEGKKWRCPYCHRVSSGSVTRVKSHFLKQLKEGIASCTRVPEHISTLMQLLHNHEVRNREDIAWKFVDRLGDNKWRCHHCREEFFGDLTGVKGHLLGVPNEGISICIKVPDHVRTLMRLLLDDVAEEESRGANGQSSMEPQSHHMPAQAEVAEEESREANSQSSAEPQSRGMPAQAEVAEEESSEANGQSFTEPQSRGMLPQPEVAEEESREANIQSSMEPQSHELPTQAEVVAEEESREANGQFSMEPQSRDMPIEDEVAEEESRETNGQSSAEPQSHDMPTQAEVVAEEESREANGQFDTELYVDLLSSEFPSAESPSTYAFKQMALQFETAISGVNSDQQSQPEHEFHESSTMPSLEQNSLGGSTSCSAMALVEAEAPHDLRDQSQCNIRSQMQMNVQQTPAGASASQYGQIRALGDSNCLRDSNQHSQLQIPLDIDPSIVSQHTINSHVTEATIVDLQVPEAATNITGPSSSEVQPASVPPLHEIVPPPQSNLRTTHQNSTILSSSWNPMDVDPCVSSSSQALNNAFPPPQIPPCGTVPIGPSSLPGMNRVRPMTSHPNTGINFELIGALKRKFNRLYSREYDIKQEVKYAASLDLKKPRMEVASWLNNVEKLKNDFPCTEAASEDCLPPPHQELDILMQEAEDLLRHGNFPNGLFERRESIVIKLIEGKMVGKAFQENTAKILDFLMENQVSRLGIYGMGGVGKTTIMKHIHNRLLEKANYGNVLWITVSQDFNIQKLHDDIWEALGLGILGEKDVRKRAARLCDSLSKREKLIIILDDVWECFDLNEVGIPVRADGLKLVLTTRSLEVCRQMHCQEKIKIEPLSQEEAESLFLEELGSEVTLNLETETTVKSIVKECAGLPLGVVTMAASMREVTDVFEWKDCLLKLKESDMGQTDMEKKVLMNLKFSYDRLGKREVQQCFLSCALYPEDKFIEKVELIEFFIDQGLIDGLNTREKQYHRGLTMLNKLGNVCLLEDHGDEMKMHDLLRDMALHIMNATSIVKASKGLMRIPPEEYWTNTLEKVSLMKNNIGEFPLNMSPNCPKLSTLLLNGCLLGNVAIPDSFFKNLLGLKVLNLSGNDMTELPNSISDLVNLRALLLRECRELRRICYLGKLTSLRKLDTRDCKSLEALEGLEKLVTLRYLDLTETRIERLPKGTLDHLLNLQCLKVSAVNEEDITKLGALETFICYPKNVDDFHKCVRVIEQSDNPRYYNLIMRLEESEFFAEVSDDTRFGNLGRRVKILDRDHANVSVGGECTGILILIPRDVQTLEMVYCNGITNLSSMGLLEYLEELEIRGWENLEVLYGGQDEEVIDIHDSPAPIPTPPLFPNLRVLKIENCPKLKYLFGHGFKSNLPHLQEIKIWECEEMVGIIAAVTSPPPNPLPFFPSLEEIFVNRCDKMKRAVESKWMPHFPNLRSIGVSECEKMEEIIGGPPPYLSVEGISLESLNVYGCNNMRKLFLHEWLLHLRNLRSISVCDCRGMVEMIGGAGQGQEEFRTTPINNTPSSFQPSSISLPKLKWLKLVSVPQLKSICEVPISCDSMKFLMVLCPELKEIPLQLRLCDIERIWVKDEEKWKTLVWDHPDAQAILQPYLRKGEYNIELDVRRKIAQDSALEERPAAQPCFPANSTQVAI